MERRVRSYLIMREYPYKFRRSVSKYHHQHWLVSQGVDDIKQTRHLPTALRVRIFRELHGAPLENLPFLSPFKDCERMWGVMMDSLSFVSFATGDFIVREGEWADALCAPLPLAPPRAILPAWILLGFLTMARQRDDACVALPRIDTCRTSCTYMQPTPAVATACGDLSSSPHGVHARARDT